MRGHCLPKLLSESVDLVHLLYVMRARCGNLCPYPAPGVVLWKKNDPPGVLEFPPGDCASIKKSIPSLEGKQSDSRYSHMMGDSKNHFYHLGLVRDVDILEDLLDVECMRRPDRQAFCEQKN